MSVRTIARLAAITGQEAPGCARCGEPIPQELAAVVRYNVADGSTWWLHRECAVAFGLDFAGDGLAAGARLQP